MATETITKFTAAAAANVEKFKIVAKDNSEALTKSGTIAFSGFEILAKSLQDLAKRNVEKLNDAFKVLSSVKTPAEFLEVQTKLVQEGYEAAVTESRAIAEHTSAVLTAAFEPVQKQVAAIQEIIKKAA